MSASTAAEQIFERVSPSPTLSRRRPTAPSEGWRADSSIPTDAAGIEAWTEYTPGRGFTYEIVREGGSDYVRNKILRGMLVSEQKLIAGGKRLHASLESMNYVFEDGGMVDGGLQRVLLKPAKKSDGILNGSVLLDPESGLITTIQGRLVKSPSFWLRDVNLTCQEYAHVGDRVVPVEMTSTGRVPMFGRSNFRMVYDYESIDGRPATLKASLRDEQ